MDILFGKIRIYAMAGTQYTITSSGGNVQTGTIPSGATFADRIVPGLDEYTVSNGISNVNVSVNYGEMVKVQLYSSLDEVSWADIQTLIQENKFADYFSVGATKTFTIGGNTYTAEAVSINDGTGAAGQWYPESTVDFITKELYTTKYRYNATNNNSGGFPSSEIKTTLNSTIYPLLPSDLKSVITAKSHSYQAGSYSSSWSSSMVTSSDNLWLPTYYEIAGGSAQYVEGENVNNNKPYILDSKIKMVNGESSASYWWLGSPFSGGSSYFWNVTTGGGFDANTASTTYGVPLCFRIG